MENSGSEWVRSLLRQGPNFWSSHFHFFVISFLSSCIPRNSRIDIGIT